MATLKNTTISDTGYLQLPVGSTGQRPAENSTFIGAMRVNDSTGKLEYWNGANWELNSTSFPFRTIITTAYAIGGYKSSVAWNNANRTSTSTDTTINLGDGSIERSFNYQWGACSKDYLYVFGAGNGHAIASNYIIAYNMRTEQQQTSPGTSTYSRARFGGVHQESYTAWYVGGNAGDADRNQIEKFNLTTLTQLGTIGQTYGTTGENWGTSHENEGVLWNNNTAGDNRRFNFSTETQTARSGTSVSNHPQQKTLQSKWNYSWQGNEGSYRGGNVYRRHTWSTDTTVNANLPKPSANCGEENYTMGQDHGYCLGQYNGSQNNISWRWNYSTESGFLGGSSMQPKGHDGMSSAVCGWRDG